MGTNCKAEKIAQFLFSIFILIAMQAIFILVADTCCDSLKKVKSDGDNFLHEFQLAIGTPGTLVESRKSDRVSMHFLSTLKIQFIFSWFIFILCFAPTGWIRCEEKNSLFILCDLRMKSKLHFLSDSISFLPSRLFTPIKWLDCVFARWLVATQKILYHSNIVAKVVVSTLCCATNRLSKRSMVVEQPAVDHLTFFY